jgi:hypothetical protein
MQHKTDFITDALQEESRLALEKAQIEVMEAFEKLKIERAQAAYQANQLWRIARKYKTQYEELKLDHEKLLALEKPLLPRQLNQGGQQQSTRKMRLPQLQM